MLTGPHGGACGKKRAPIREVHCARSSPLKGSRKDTPSGTLLRLIADYIYTVTGRASLIVLLITYVLNESLLSPPRMPSHEKEQRGIVDGGAVRLCHLSCNAQ